MNILIVIFFVGTSAFVAHDAFLNKIPVDNKPYSVTNGAIAWFLACILLWIVFVPYYFVKRSKMLRQRNNGIMPINNPGNANVFSYRAKTSDGKDMNGKLEAWDSKDAISKLHSMGLLIVSLNEEKGDEVKKIDTRKEVISDVMKSLLRILLLVFIIIGSGWVVFVVFTTGSASDALLNVLNSPLRLLVGVSVLVIYFLPAIVAVNNKNPQRTAIFVLNLFLGWTLLGWVIALVWAYVKEK
jgi:hypothetical protein